jgi:hypothetical protein
MRGRSFCHCVANLLLFRITMREKVAICIGLNVLRFSGVTYPMAVWGLCLKVFNRYVNLSVTIVCF